MRAFGYITLSVVVVTIIWVFTFVMGQITSTQGGTLDERIAAVESGMLLFKITYLNAAVLTALCVAMFAGFFVYCKPRDAVWSAVAFAAVPIYGVANLMAYLSQVLVVPNLIEIFKNPATSSHGEALLRLSLHTFPGSAIEALNAGAYASLGIPSIIFPLICFIREPGLKIGGWLMALSGVLSLIAFAGVLLSFRSLLFFSPLGGFVFLTSLFPIARFFLKAK